MGGACRGVQVTGREKATLTAILGTEDRNEELSETW